MWNCVNGDHFSHDCFLLILYCLLSYDIELYNFTYSCGLDGCFVSFINDEKAP